MSNLCVLFVFTLLYTTAQRKGIPTFHFCLPYEKFILFVGNEFTKLT